MIDLREVKCGTMAPIDSEEGDIVLIRKLDLDGFGQS